MWSINSLAELYILYLPFFISDTDCKISSSTNLRLAFFIKVSRALVFFFNFMSFIMLLYQIQVKKQLIFNFIRLAPLQGTHPTRRLVHHPLWLFQLRFGGL